MRRREEDERRERLEGDGGARRRHEQRLRVEEVELLQQVRERRRHAEGRVGLRRREEHRLEEEGLQRRAVEPRRAAAQHARRRVVDLAHARAAVRRRDDGLHQVAREGGRPGRRRRVERRAQREEEERRRQQHGDVRADVRLAIDLREVQVVADECEREARRAPRRRQPRNERSVVAAKMKAGERSEDERQEGDAGERHRRDGELGSRDEAVELTRRLAVATVLGHLEAGVLEPRIEGHQLRKRAHDGDAEDDAKDGDDCVDWRRRRDERLFGHADVHGFGRHLGCVGHGASDKNAGKRR